jgi:hypothetical protein
MNIISYTNQYKYTKSLNFSITRLIFIMQILLGAISQLKKVGSGVYQRNGTIQISEGQMSP